MANATQVDVDAEEAMLKAFHKTKVKHHTDTLDTYRTNKELLYGVISDKIMKGVQEQLERESNYAIKKPRTLYGYYKGSNIIALPIKAIDTYLPSISMPLMA